MGNLDSHLDAAAVLGGHLVAEQAVKELEIGRLGTRRFAEHGVDPLSDVAEREAAQVLDDASVNEVAHCAHPSTMRA